MKKKILLLAMLPACTAFAQSLTVHEDRNRPPVISGLTPEINDTELQLTKAMPGQGSQSVPLLVSSGAEQEQLKASFDYFPAEELLNNPTHFSGELHDVRSEHFSNVLINLEGNVYKDLDCYMIHDRYHIKSPHELPGDFQYNNTYFLYKNQNGETLVTVIYVESTIGNLKAQRKIVKKGIAAMTGNILSIAPNPAQKDISITCNIAAVGPYTLHISNMGGKVMVTLFDKKQLTRGTLTISLALNLTPGIYMVTLSTEHAATVTQKLIIQ